jgi:hypothetical protein
MPPFAHLGRRCILKVATVVVLVWSGAARAQPYNSGQTPFTNWISTLQNSGYTVTSGTVAPFSGCSYFIASFGTCFGNNTATPYLLTQPPVTYPNNLPSYAYATGSGFTGSAPSNPANEQITDDMWQIGNDEAVVTVITLPPQGAYFGFQTYMLERDAAAYSVYPTGTTCTGGTP